MSATMRAVVITEPGGPEVLQIQSRPLPEPGAGEVRVRVAAFGLNRAELLHRRGLYPSPPGPPPDIPGLEYAGRVELLGTGVTGWNPGDRVMGIVSGASNAEALVAPADQLLPIPDGVDDPTAAAFPEAYLTAHDALEQLGLRADEWLLIHAVGSGVGTAALQIARVRGARCVGTSRSAAKLEAARALGLEVGIDSQAEPWVEALRRAVPDGVDAVIDLVGGSLLPATLETLAPRGRLILVGLTAGRRAELDLGRILGQRLHIVGTVLRPRSPAEKAAVAAHAREHLLPLLAEGRLRPVLHEILPFERIQDAHRMLEENRNFGKIVVRVDA